MIIRPQADSSGTITANTTFLVPSFEATRARLLKMPFLSDIELITWEEHWNPYTTLFDSWDSLGKRIMVDDEMRDFIQRGLGSNGFEILGLGGEVERVKQTKSAREVEIVRAVNTGTLEALRAMRTCMHSDEHRGKKKLN